MFCKSGRVSFSSESAPSTASRSPNPRRNVKIVPMLKKMTFERVLFFGGKTSKTKLLIRILICVCLTSPSIWKVRFFWKINLDFFYIEKFEKRERSLGVDGHLATIRRLWLPCLFVCRSRRQGVGTPPESPQSSFVTSSRRPDVTVISQLYHGLCLLGTYNFGFKVAMTVLHGQNRSEVSLLPSRPSAYLPIASLVSLETC